MSSDPLSGRATRRAVTAHYDRHENLVQRIHDALPAAGGDPERPTYDALHQLDQFHLGGPRATRELAEHAGLRDADVLDLGCGIGGPARTLSAEYGCRVTGVDLTETFCRIAHRLSAEVGLAAVTRFVRASVDALPLAADTWAWVWSQHAIMNVPDTPRMYAEVARVLAPGGRFVHHDIVAGPDGPPYFPVPWASEPAASFLQPPGSICDQLHTAGLVQCDWRELTDDVIAHLRASRAARDAGEPDSPGPHLVLGPSFHDMRANLGRSLEDQRARVVQGIWQKPA
jgi:SAM-dependent methyltransferase